MSTRQNPDAMLKELRENAGKLSRDEEVGILREVLTRGSRGHILTALSVVTEERYTELANALETAFRRLMAQPLKRDKGCIGMNAIIEALNALDLPGGKTFAVGIRHVQMEPVWGGQEDTAANLRANCAMAMARMGEPDALFEIASLLNDPEPQARRGAVKALEYLGTEPCELMLRVKAGAGDTDGDVLAECLAALMRIAPDRSLAFVAAYLTSDEEFVAEGAALALGESRLEEALAILLDAWERNVDQRFRRMLALPLALTRHDEAFALLLPVVRDGQVDTARAVVEALRLWREDVTKVSALRQAVEARDDGVLRRCFEEAFE